jgi:stage IV sporulation protein FB
MILLLQIFFFPFTLSAFLLFLFLIWENRTEWKNHTFIFLRFLLARTEQRKKATLAVSPQMKLMDVFYLFRRNRTHPVQVNDQYILTEEQCLAYYFKDKKLHETIGQLVAKKE